MHLKPCRKLDKNYSTPEFPPWPQGAGIVRPASPARQAIPPRGGLLNNVREHGTSDLFRTHHESLIIGNQGSSITGR